MEGDSQILAFNFRAWKLAHSQTEHAADKKKNIYIYIWGGGQGLKVQERRKSIGDVQRIRSSERGEEGGQDEVKGWLNFPISVG